MKNAIIYFSYKSDWNKNFSLSKMSGIMVFSGYNVEMHFIHAGHKMRKN
jgi:hypothetical protein